MIKIIVSAALVKCSEVFIMVQKISFTLKKKNPAWSNRKEHSLGTKNVPQKAFVSVLFRSCGCQRISCKFLSVTHRVPAATGYSVDDMCESSSKKNFLL